MKRKKISFSSNHGRVAAGFEKGMTIPEKSSRGGDLKCLQITSKCQGSGKTETVDSCA